MKNQKLELHEIKLVGIAAKTSNSLETNPETAKIRATIDNYLENNLAEKIAGRLKPGTTYCVYTSYESDEHGEYLYFVGEEVGSFDNLDPMFTKLTIPAALYTKFECGPGKMPTVCIDAWGKIWQMSEVDLGGKRSYIADFEIYDQRAKDFANTTLDIYIGIKR